MEVRNCKSCKRLFNYLGGMPICPACKDELEKKYSDVREYIRTNPKATLNEISEDNDVSIAQLRQWVREERLQFSKDSPVGIECENCGATIRTGRFCEACKKNLANTLSNSIARPSATHQEERRSNSHENKMRFI